MTAASSVEEGLGATVGPVSDTGATQGPNSPALPALRMHAYYYDFGETGVREIDLILSAVACAGKAFHGTEDWNEQCDYRPEALRGDTPVDWIQNAADDAATAFKAKADGAPTRQEPDAGSALVLNPDLLPGDQP
jgi:hypothetical protein